MLTQIIAFFVQLCAFSSMETANFITLTTSKRVKYLHVTPQTRNPHAIPNPSVGQPLASRLEIAWLRSSDPSVQAPTHELFPSFAGIPTLIFLARARPKAAVALGLAPRIIHTQMLDQTRSEISRQLLLLAKWEGFPGSALRAWGAKQKK